MYSRAHGPRIVGEIAGRSPWFANMVQITRLNQTSYVYFAVDLAVGDVAFHPT